MSGEKAEEHREPLARAHPGVTAERGHSEESDIGVDRDRERERARARGVRVRKLEGGERKDRDNPRPPSEPLGVFGERPRLAPAPFPCPDVGVRERAPRRKGAPDVAEDDREGRKPEPEDHQDPDRREVPVRVGVAEQRSRPHEGKERDRQHLDGDPERPEHGPRDPARQGPTPLVLLEHRPLPESTEQDEGDDEDDARAPVEQPRRDRKILDGPDPVADEAQGRTSRTARSESGWWSSTSNRPGIVRVSGTRTGFPGVTGFSMS